MLRAHGWWLLILVIAAAAGATLAVASASRSDSHGAVARFREIEQTHSTLGAFAGSTETWRTAVLLLRDPRTIGTGVVVCHQIEAGSQTRECQATYTLPEGQIQLGGIVKDRGHYTLMIVAATGVYAGREGTMAVSRVGTSPRSAFLTFYLT